MKHYLTCLLTLFFLVACQPEPAEKNTLSTEPTACTKDAKLCPDGQTVSRNPDLNCDFNPCPKPMTEKACQGDMKQCADGSFVIRDPDKQCAFKTCPDQSRQPEPVMYCTQDVAQCADGSYVGRDPQNDCAFKPCPDGSTPPRSKTSLD